MLPRTLSLLAVLLLSGCIGTGPDATTDEGTKAPGCGLIYPDGSPNDCRQDALAATAVTPGPEHLCVDTTPPGRNTARILRDATGNVVLAPDLDADRAHGVAWLGSDPSRMWSWTDAPGDAAWMLGPVPTDEDVWFWTYAVDVVDRNDTTAEPSIDQRWSLYDGQPYPVHRIVADDGEHWLDATVGFTRDNRTAYRLVPFIAWAGEHWFEASYRPLARGALTNHQFPRLSGC